MELRQGTLDLAWHKIAATVASPRKDQSGRAIRATVKAVAGTQ